MTIPWLRYLQIKNAIEQLLISKQLPKKTPLTHLEYLIKSMNPQSLISN